MNRTEACTAAILFAAPILFPLAAAGAPFAAGDPAAGEKLLEKSCIACHASKFGGDGSSIYTRSDRMVKSAPQLLARIKVCNAATHAGWRPAEETDAAAYLNRTYYHFP